MAHDVVLVTGSSDEVEVVYREQRARLWRSLVAYTGQQDLSSDALAEAFAQLLARGRAVRDPAAWVWRAAFQIARGELKRGSVTSEMARTETAYVMAEPLVDLLHALSSLTPKQRLAIVLHDYADRPTDEVARIMHSRKATVHVHLSQGRARLRRLLEERDG